MNFFQFLTDVKRNTEPYHAESWDVRNCDVDHHAAMINAKIRHAIRSGVRPHDLIQAMVRKWNEKKT